MKYVKRGGKEDSYSSCLLLSVPQISAVMKKKKQHPYTLLHPTLPLPFFPNTVVRSVGPYIISECCSDAEDGCRNNRRRGGPGI